MLQESCWQAGPPLNPSLLAHHRRPPCPVLPSRRCCCGRSSLRRCPWSSGAACCWACGTRSTGAESWSTALPGSCSPMGGCLGEAVGQRVWLESSWDGLHTMPGGKRVRAVEGRAWQPGTLHPCPNNPSPSPPSPFRLGDEPVQIKLFARLRCCCQLEAVLDQLLQVGLAASCVRCGRGMCRGCGCLLSLL